MGFLVKNFDQSSLLTMGSIIISLLWGEAGAVGIAEFGCSPGEASPAGAVSNASSAGGSVTGVDFVGDAAGCFVGTVDTVAGSWAMANWLARPLLSLKNPFRVLCPAVGGVDDWAEPDVEHCTETGEPVSYF
jgi:hypothetical protein